MAVIKHKVKGALKKRLIITKNGKIKMKPGFTSHRMSRRRKSAVMERGRGKSVLQSSSLIKLIKKTNFMSME